MLVFFYEFYFRKMCWVKQCLSYANNFKLSNEFFLSKCEKYNIFFIMIVRKEISYYNNKWSHSLKWQD